MAEDNITNQVFFDKYKAVKKLGQGSFGTVFQGVNLKSQELIAIKLEAREENTNLLETEAYRLIYLKGEGVPKVFCYGNNKNYNILVIELLGKSLEDLFNMCSRKFSLKTVCVIGIEMIKRIQYVHEKNHIHRDIKPDNFMMGVNNHEDKLYIIDFGLAKKYRSSTKKGHIPFKSNKNITGTARYCSINTHRGYEQSRRDDLESIGYMLMYFLRGSLPWQGLKCKQDEDHYHKIYEKKKATTTEELCKGFPEQFSTFFDYVKSLGFQADPDYELLTNLFIKVINSYCTGTPYDFDWNNKLKSSIHDYSTNFTYQKANTSLALGNHNISRCSPNKKDDSHYNQVNEDINNMSIFHKELDIHNGELEPSLGNEENERDERDANQKHNQGDLKNIGEQYIQANTKKQNTKTKNTKSNSKDKLHNHSENPNEDNNNGKALKPSNLSTNIELLTYKKEKTTSCRCLIF